MELITQVLELFDERGIVYDEKRKSVVIDCPSCGKEKHCWVRKENLQTICFKCGTSWSWKRMVAAVLGITQSEAVNLVYGKNTGDFLGQMEALEIDKDSHKPNPFSLSPDLNQAQSLQSEENELKPIFLTPDFISVDGVSRAEKYLAERGIVDTRIKSLYDLRYQALVDAIIFPVYRDGSLYGWQGRSIPPLKEGRLRLVNSTGFNKSRFLLNYDRAKTQDRLVLVEGPFDCMHVDVPGFGAVCSFGKTVSPYQIRMILESSAKEVYIGLDKDAADEVYDLAEALSPAKRVFRIVPPDNRKDFGECSQQEVLASFDLASELSGYPSSRLEVYFKS